MGAGNKPVPEAVRAEAQSFIHRVEYSGEGGVCAAHIRVQGQGPQAELSAAPEHQVPGRCTHQLESTGNTAQLLKNFSTFAFVSQGEGREEGRVSRPFSRSK